MEIVSYDPNSCTLVVSFPNEGVHEFFDVAPQTFEEMKRADSPQDYFNTHLWNRNEHNTHWPSLGALLAFMEDHMCFPEGPLTVDSLSCDGDTPLHIACIWGDIGAIDLLISGGADINARGDEEFTPVYHAVLFSRTRSVERLLTAGASLDDDNRFGVTARERAVRNNDPRIVALLKRLDGGEL